MRVQTFCASIPVAQLSRRMVWRNTGVLRSIATRRVDVLQE